MEELLGTMVVTRVRFQPRIPEADMCLISRFGDVAQKPISLSDSNQLTSHVVAHRKTLDYSPLKLLIILTQARGHALTSNLQRTFPTSTFFLHLPETILSSRLS